MEPNKMLTEYHITDSRMTPKCLLVTLSVLSIQICITTWTRPSFEKLEFTILALQVYKYLN